MEKKIEREAAEVELKGILDFFEVEMDDESDDWKGAREKLLKIIERGRLVLDTAKCVMRLELVIPLQLGNGQEVKALEIHEPTGEEMKSLDKYGDKEKVGKSLALTSSMTRQPLGVIQRLCSRDLGAVSALTMLFF